MTASIVFKYTGYIVKIISMKQLREKFNPIRKALEKGESFMLMYRSKPLGIIRPYAAETDANLLMPSQTKPLLPEVKPLRTLPEPQKIAIEAPSLPQLPPKQKALDKFGIKKFFS